MIRSPKKCFCQETLEKFGKTKLKFHKSIQKSISKIRGGKIPRKKPSQSIGQQRIQPAKKPSKVLRKIVTPFKTSPVRWPGDDRPDGTKISNVHPNMLTRTGNGLQNFPGEIRLRPPVSPLSPHLISRV